MNKTLAATLGACALCFSIQAFAGAGWTDYTTVAELVPTSHPYYAVRLPVKDNPSGCSHKTWFYQNYGALGADKIYLTLLEAVKSKLKVRVYVTGNCDLHGYSEISSVSVIR
ncbi:MAG TPA: hypothetical protein VKA50_02960 [Gammaproteobacteria bacterium]|nr:hypothetical protein [Gammaproteobacteria bacterium]